MSLECPVCKTEIVINEITKWHMATRGIIDNPLKWAGFCVKCCNMVEVSLELVYTAKVIENPGIAPTEIWRDEYES